MVNSSKSHQNTYASANANSPTTNAADNSPSPAPRAPRDKSFHTNRRKTGKKFSSLVATPTLRYRLNLTFHIRFINSKYEYRNSKQIQNPKFEFFNLETAAGRKKDVQDIGVNGEIQNVVVNFVVMRHFCILPGAPRGCADFCDPTVVSRIMR